MGVQENWLANLRKTVDAEAHPGDVRSGYRAVAVAAGLSEEYIYQLYQGKPKTDGSPRTMGTTAAKAVARAFARGRPLDWFDLPPGTYDTEKTEPQEPKILAEALQSLGPEARREALEFIAFKLERSNAPFVQENRARYLRAIQRLQGDDGGDDDSLTSGRR